MGKLVSPKVFLVGRTEMNDAGMNDYLRHTGNEEFIEEIEKARSQGIPDGLILCSFFAKLCYAALVVGKNDNITRVREIRDNLVATFDAGHGCYDADTEVLTSDGWVPWPDVSEHHLLATHDASGQLVYRNPVAVRSFQHKGQMYHVESQGVDLLVTPNHRMYVCPTTTREGRKKTDYRLIEASDLDTVSHAYTKVADWKKPDTGVSVDELRLLGFAIGDGYYSGNGNVIRFRLRRERKIAWLNSLVQSLVRSGGSWSISEHGDRYDVRCPVEFVELAAKMYDSATRDKKIPSRLLISCSSAELLGLFEGLMQSDGSEGRTGDCFDTTSRILADQMQQLCLHIGLAANVCYEYESSDRPDSYGDKTLIRLSILRRNLKPEVNKCKGVGRSYWVEGWEGEVFCAQMPSDTGHVLYVRRNGKPVWCGNSVFEHCSINFVITGCSRVFTHELVRHRVGTAFSQTSGRYVRTDSLDIVFDPILEPVREDIKDIQFYLEQKYAAMVKKMGLDEMKDFDKKKKATSALRRILPNGQANEIGFTLNVRSLRHLTELRTARFSEWEIREVFNQIASLIQTHFPWAFHGATMEICDGLLEYSGMVQQPYGKGK